MKKIAITVLIAGLISSCAKPMIADRYAGGASSFSFVDPSTGVNVGEFKSETAEYIVNCRVGIIGVELPGRNKYADYFKDAFQYELQKKGKYSPESSIFLSGTIDPELNTTSGYWKMNLILKSTTGQSFAVESKTSFESFFRGETACQEAAKAFEPAVKDVIGKALQDKRINGLMRR